MSSANEVKLIMVPEVTYGTTPVDDAGWKTLRFVRESVSATPLVNQSEEIRNDRMRADQFKTSMDVNGGFDFELSYGTFDDLIAAALNNDWATNVLKIGSVDKSLSIEKQFTDLSANNFLLFDGMRVSEMSMGFAHGEPVNGSFAFMGSDAAAASASAVGAGTLADPTSTPVMNAVSDLSSLEIDDVAFTGCLSAVNFNINNNLRPQRCIGSDFPQNQILGTADVTGTIEAYLTDTTVQWYTNRVLNQSAIAIAFTVARGGNSYEFYFPNCRLSGDAPQAEGIDTDVMIRANFTALYDETEDSSIVITRVAA